LANTALSTCFQQAYPQHVSGTGDKTLDFSGALWYSLLTGSREIDGPSHSNPRVRVASGDRAKAQEPRVGAKGPWVKDREPDELSGVIA